MVQYFDSTVNGTLLHLILLYKICLSHHKDPGQSLRKDNFTVVSNVLRVPLRNETVQYNTFWKDAGPVPVPVPLTSLQP